MLNMSVKDLVLKNRSCRRFHQSQRIERPALEALVDLARLSPSGANLQPLKYMVINEPEDNARVFPYLAWAGYLKDWSGPGEGERPSAYIIILNDKEIKEKAGCDHGIAAQSMLLGAVEKDLAGCIIGSIQREGLRRELSIPERFDILLVLALGPPAETIVIDDLGTDGDIKYWRDDFGVHHVPKRSLGEIIIGENF